MMKYSQETAGEKVGGRGDKAGVVVRWNFSQKSAIIEILKTG
jgi:hypothetical protein